MWVRSSFTKFPVSRTPCFFFFLLAQPFQRYREVSLCAGYLETSLSASSARVSVFFHVRAYSRLLISGPSWTVVTIVNVLPRLGIKCWKTCIFLWQVEENNATVIVLLFSFRFQNDSLLLKGTSVGASLLLPSLFCKFLYITGTRHPDQYIEQMCTHQCVSCILMWPKRSRWS